MTVSIVHATSATLPDEPGAEINAAQWNEGHTVTGLGTMAEQAAADYLAKADNLSGLADAATARSNLELGSAALLVGSSGTYTPTLTHTSNVTGSTAFAAQWFRIGDGVVVSGAVLIDPNLASTETVLGISLPVASNFANTLQASGTANNTTLHYTGHIRSNVASDRAELVFTSGADVTSTGWRFIFTYQVI